jgi:hypothetical protein
LPESDLLEVMDWILPRFAEKMGPEHGQGLLADWKRWRREFQGMADSEDLLHL